ncbi:MAG TPA: VOC family protein [Baekduia sp.]|nr:VOC family protein [Baekduia sp.]
MSDQAIPFTGVSELALEVPDLEVAERFYTEVLGLPVVERWTDRHPSPAHAVWLMAGDRTRIGLWEPMIGLGKAQGGVHVHFVLHTPPESFDAAIERIESHGVDVFVWDHSGYGYGRGMAAYFHDPAGHCIELWTWDVAEHLVEHGRGESPGTL